MHNIKHHRPIEFRAKSLKYNLISWSGLEEKNIKIREWQIKYEFGKKSFCRVLEMTGRVRENIDVEDTMPIHKLSQLERERE